MTTEFEPTAPGSAAPSPGVPSPGVPSPAAPSPAAPSGLEEPAAEAAPAAGSGAEPPAGSAVGPGAEPAAGPGAGSAPASASATEFEPATEEDLAVVAAQLGRTPRGTRAVAHRCPCGLPDVVETTPRLPDGTPFPTLFYLTCPRAVHECSRLESSGLMREMGARLAEDPELRKAYEAAHEDYLRRREQVGHVDEIAGVSAGGMPTRVKCLHVHLGHALAVGPGVNPFGDETLALAAEWWAAGPCVPPPA